MLVIVERDDDNFNRSCIIISDGSSSSSATNCSDSRYNAGNSGGFTFSYSNRACCSSSGDIVGFGN
jgi:hypothetical protein